MDNETGWIVFETPRLTISIATVQDAELAHSLWTDPRVMRNVGFPNGLRVTLDDVRNDILNRVRSEFTQILIARLKSTQEAIGQCVMHPPDEQGIAETDVKLLPVYWGHRFGIEIKQGLLDYLFTHTDCEAVQATPNVGNIASIKMQEAVGGVKVGESVHEFAEEMQAFTTPVRHYIYRVYRQDWLVRKKDPVGMPRAAR